MAMVEIVAPLDLDRVVEAFRHLRSQEESPHPGGSRDDYGKALPQEICLEEMGFSMRNKR